MLVTIETVMTTEEMSTLNAEKPPFIHNYLSGTMRSGVNKLLIHMTQMTLTILTLTIQVENQVEGPQMIVAIMTAEIYNAQKQLDRALAIFQRDRLTQS